MEEIDCTILLGGTSVGKSSFLYENFSEKRLQIISADSMQVYQGFNVATATPPQKDLKKFPHALLNEIPPSDEFSVSEFLDRADEACRKAADENYHPVVLGGTGLYIKAFLYGLDDMPDSNPDFREKMRKKSRDESSDVLHERLSEVDPDSARKIHPNDTKRVIRALEIYHETGKTKTELQSEDVIRSWLNPSIIGLERPKPEMKERILDRIDFMIDNGLIEEVKSLKELNSLSETLKQAIGYQSVSDYLDDKIDIDTVVDRMFDRTWNLYRKQKNWFKRFPVENWYHPEDDKRELIETVGNKLN